MSLTSSLKTSSPDLESAFIDGTFQYRVACADSRGFLKSLPDKVFSSVITSPPYWGMRTYGHDSEIGREETVDEYIAGLVSIFREIKRVLREDGTVWLVIGDSYTSGNRTYRASDKKSKARAMTYRPKTPDGLKEKDIIGLPWRVAFALQADGWYLRTDIVWAKPNPMPETVKDRPHRSHEFIFLLSKAPNYFFDREAFSNPLLGKGLYGKTVWTVPVGIRRTPHFHPAAFPLDLIYPCIISSTRPGDLILDPFAGSGSVGIASLKVGRRFFGIELVEEYAEAANTMLGSLVQQNTLHSV